MLEEFNKAIEVYLEKWLKLVNATENKAFFSALRPTAIGWKTEDRVEHQKRFLGLGDQCDQIHFGWLNERWITTLHLRGQKLMPTIELIKLMQRRPGSTDAVGLDHIDFLIPEGADAKDVLGRESGIKWTEEKNGDFCNWISIWFEGTEAKLRTDTTFDVGAAELTSVSKKIKAGL